MSQPDKFWREAYRELAPDSPVLTDCLFEAIRVRADELRALAQAANANSVLNVPQGLIDDALRWNALLAATPKYPELNDHLQVWLQDYKRRENADAAAVYLAVFSEADPPAAESTWTHRNGNDYVVLGIANLQARPGYLPTVVYRSVDSSMLYTRPLSDWRRSMTPKQVQLE